jgi:hypothetical protein
MYTYNTNQGPLKLKEYGRNVQKLVAQLQQVEDKTIRNQYAQGILKIMNLLHSSGTKLTSEHSQKRWDDLFIIADYNLDIESPYPMPSREILINRPQQLSYSKHPIKYRHCGRHIELVIKKILEESDPAKQADMLVSTGKLIKSFSAAWNKDNMDSNTVLSIIQDLAGGKLAVDIERLKSESIFSASNNVLKEKNKMYKNKKVNFASKLK